MTSTGIFAKTLIISTKKCARNPDVSLIKIVLNIQQHPFWRRKLKEILLALLNSPKDRLSADDIEVRVRAFVVITVTLILFFIVVTLIYSVMFVSQPIKAMAPIDQAFTKMLNDIVLLIVGGIGGIMTKGLTNEATAMMNNVKAGKDAYVAPPPAPVVMMSSAGWTPPPPPMSPPTLEADHERERMAQARASNV